MLGALSTTQRFIEASTAAGVPIVVGGSAFGHDDVRARALAHLHFNDRIMYFRR
jgi:hypothetical protein